MILQGIHFYISYSLPIHSLSDLTLPYLYTRVGTSTPHCLLTHSSLNLLLFTWAEMYTYISSWNFLIKFALPVQSLLSTVVECLYSFTVFSSIHLFNFLLLQTFPQLFTILTKHHHPRHCYILHSMPPWIIFSIHLFLPYFINYSIWRNINIVSLSIKMLDIKYDFLQTNCTYLSMEALLCKYLKNHVFLDIVHFSGHLKATPLEVSKHS